MKKILCFKNNLPFLFCDIDLPKIVFKYIFSFFVCLFVYIYLSLTRYILNVFFK